MLNTKQRCIERADLFGDTDELAQWLTEQIDCRVEDGDPELSRDVYYLDEIRTSLVEMHKLLREMKLHLSLNNSDVVADLVALQRANEVARGKPTDDEIPFDLPAAVIGKPH